METIKEEHGSITKAKAIDVNDENKRIDDDVKGIEMRGIAKEVAPSSVSSHRSLFKFAEECIAQSLLVFLVADLRLLSGTGRVYTKYETICLDSDEIKKTTAADLIGVTSSPEDQSPSTKRRTKGLSPAQMMAILIVEIRKEMQQHRKLDSDQNEVVEESFVSTVINPEKKVKNVEDMHGLLKAYNEMIARDLNTKAPTVMAGEVLFPQMIAHHLNQAKTNVENLAKSMFVPASKHDTDTETAGAAFSVRNLFSSASSRHHHEQDSSGRENLSHSERRPDAKPKFMPTLPQFNEEKITRQRLAEVGDTLFQLGVDPGGRVTESIAANDRNRVLSEDELLDLMEKAVESRIPDRTNFMSTFFKEGSVSHLLAISKAKIVWVNDWYPMKDLMYAISVDKEAKSVFVLFRGCTTGTDWGKTTQIARFRVPNPIQDNFKNKKTLKFHKGFYSYLFRKRKDTGTTKYDEIVTKVHFYGMQEIGPDYTAVVTGLSLGGALSTIFAFFASTDHRLTKNGPVTAITFGSPMVGGRAFADSFRHQEKIGKLRYARFINEHDLIAHLPFNIVPTKRGSKFQHVGMAIYLRCKRKHNCCHGTCPKIFLSHGEEESFTKSYGRALKKNFLLNLPLPWNIGKFHHLDEHLERLIHSENEIIRQGDSNLLDRSLEEIYLTLLNKS